MKRFTLNPYHGLHLLPGHAVRRIGLVCDKADLELIEKSMLQTGVVAGICNYTIHAIAKQLSANPNANATDVVNILRRLTTDVAPSDAGSVATPRRTNAVRKRATTRTKHTKHQASHDAARAAE